MFNVIFDGIEVDVLSLGDADCIVVTKWQDSVPHRILIDGGRDGDAETILDFLLGRDYTEFWAAICTHLHDDHASGLIKVVRSPHITIHNGYMRDIRSHITADALRRASSADDGVRQVVETTKELASAFASRDVPVYEPFAGDWVADWPDMTVLGPSLPFLRKDNQGIYECEPDTCANPGAFPVERVVSMGARWETASDF